MPLALARRLAVGLALATPVVTPVAAASAQSTPPAAPLGCGCAAEFDRLTARLQADYLGFAHRTAGHGRATYDSLVAATRPRATAAEAARDDAACIATLRTLTDWFGDPHLFIGEFPDADSARAAGRTSPAARHPTTEVAARDTIAAAQAKGTLDPVEGIWYAKGGERYAVLRDSGTRFVAVSLAGPTAGEVRGELVKRPDGGWAARLRGPEGAWRHPTVALEREGMLLHMAPVTWGRAFPVAEHLAGTLDAADPRAPVVYTTGGGADGTVVVAIPSHSPEYRQPLEALLERQRAAIEQAALLVVDVRGNEGGSSTTTRALMPWLASRERRAPLGPQGSPAVLASPAHVAYWKRQSWAPKGLAARMEAATPGTLVPFEDAPEGANATRASALADVEPASRAPARVALVADRHSVSAAEAFVLAAVTHAKVTLYGEPTGGSIDYQNVAMGRLACRARGVLLGFPTMAASDRLPAGALNATGIVPHVRVPTDAPDPLAWVRRHALAAAR